MRLPRPFYRLPVRFDVERLRAEVAELPAGAWAPHPNDIPGNASVRLISAEGGENDDVTGRMLPTPRLRAAPYLRQVLASFGVVWSRSRLMRLAPGASVPPHADINYHWFSRVRLHIPVQTHPDVTFHCGDEQVHMAAGEAWVFDNWRPHRVENPTGVERIHLVADTSGTAPFWHFVAQGETPAAQWRQHRFDPAADARVMTENNVAPAIMPPAEVELLLGDLGRELAALDGSDEARSRLARYRLLFEDFCHDWRQLWALHGGDGSGRADFERACEALRAGSRQLGEALVMATNGVAAHRVLEARVLRHLLRDAQSPGPRRSPARPAALQAPIFIVAAPRSGSTLLFETLAAHGAIATLGGEAHWLVEALPELRPGGAWTDSNRLTAAAMTPAVGNQLLAAIRARLQDSSGQPAGDRPLRFLEKTPKNALRIPFFHALFPDARFVFLWRDPRENISSIIEAWRSGGWVTYPGLPGWDGPWSLLLPPQWQQQRGRPVEEIAAWQWDSANRYIGDDLAALPREQWAVVRYDELRDAPRTTVERLCAFLGLEVDASLAGRLAQPLPLSRHTHTPPAPDKWRQNAALIDRVLPAVESTWHRLQQLR
ncbi:MAG: sulfotransferase [Chromatiales bacterium]|nr:sulfotransferase [Chromatiales bacterium]